MSQYTALHASATSGVTASPSTSAIAAIKFSYTIWYCASVTPRETCLWAMRLSMTTGSGAESSTRCDANFTTDAASAFCCACCFWLPRLNRSEMSSGWAANILE